MVLPSNENGKRKRPRKELEDTSSGQPKSDAIKAEVFDNDDDDGNPPIGGPLEGVIACLSGFVQSRKDELHRLILDLGGRYTRELNLDRNTHLITENAQGAKFELASSSNPPIIHIVTPSWVNSTAESGRRACETDHSILESTIKSSGGNWIGATNFAARDHLALANDALLEGDRGGDLDLSRSFLFKNHQFYLIGFEGNPTLKQRISKLVRRGSGTIHWGMNEDISILLLCDGCDNALRKAAKVVTAHHSNFPPVVSPLWVVDSYKRGTLEAISEYSPTEGKSLEANGRNDRMKSTIKGAKKASKTSLSSTTSNVSIFRGCLFSLVRSSTLTEHEQSNFVNSDNVEFDSKELETLITVHGGQTLSNKLLGALRADEGKNNGPPKRKCHVVCWGVCPPRLESNPLISQLQRQYLCEIVLVTPIWVKACVSARKLIKLELMPWVLAPQSWPMKSVLRIPSQPQQSDKNGEASQRRLEIALTGFQGTEKVVVIHLIDAIGGAYHDSMSTVCTHLVFKKKPVGLKLEKAIEWDLHIVSIGWLYHIARYGYGGESFKNFQKRGCERKFAYYEKGLGLGKGFKKRLTGKQCDNP